MIGDDGDVDGQLMTVVIGAGGDDVHAVDALHLRPFPGGRPDLIFGRNWFMSDPVPVGTGSCLIRFRPELVHVGSGSGRNLFMSDPVPAGTGSCRIRFRPELVHV